MPKREVRIRKKKDLFLAFDILVFIAVNAASQSSTKHEHGYSECPLRNYGKHQLGNTACRLDSFVYCSSRAGLLPRKSAPGPFGQKSVRTVL
jgi:hypothetical protein